MLTKIQNFIEIQSSRLCVHKNAESSSFNFFSFAIRKCHTHVYAMIIGVFKPFRPSWCKHCGSTMLRLINQVMTFAVLCSSAPSTHLYAGEYVYRVKIIDLMIQNLHEPNIICFGIIMMYIIQCTPITPGSL